MVNKLSYFPAAFTVRRIKLVRIKVQYRLLQRNRKKFNVVMVRQYRHGIQETIIEVPGGCVDETDEDYQSAIARELLEETGYEFSNYTYLGKVSPNPSTNNNWMHMFLATGGTKISSQKLDHNEEIEVDLLELDELKSLIENNEIKQALHVCTIMYGLAKLHPQQTHSRKQG